MEARYRSAVVEYLNFVLIEDSPKSTKYWNGCLKVCSLSFLFLILLLSLFLFLLALSSLSSSFLPTVPSPWPRDFLLSKAPTQSPSSHSKNLFFMV